MGLVLDSGGLIAFDQGDRHVAAMVEAARRRSEPITTSSGCVAQSWRRGGSRHALLARLLGGVNEVGLVPDVSRNVGRLCGDTDSNDVVDAHVALLARPGDVVLTSDAEDLKVLLRAIGSGALVMQC